MIEPAVLSVELALEHFTESQRSIIHSVQDVIIDKLTLYLQKASVSNDAKRAFFFVLHVALTADKHVTSEIAKLIYCVESNMSPFFLKLNELITGNAPDHKCCQSINSPKLMIDQSPNNIKQSNASLGVILKHEVKLWVKDKLDKKLFTMKEIVLLSKKYRAIIDASPPEQAPELAIR